MSDDPTSDEPDDELRIVDEALSRALGGRYLTYALSTIMHRALPDVRDGLKPVHRRILYAMRQMRLNPDGGFKKSAKVVGEVMGSFHPHGDQSIYDAMVRLAQDFASRYPLVDGQGNFGNVDGDNPAAMRYTESRMTPVALSLLEGLSDDAVDFSPNYDGIPPHNVDELCQGLLHLLKTPNATFEKLVDLIPGPDFPTGGVIVEPRANIVDAYKTGRGGFRLRSAWHKEDLGRGKYQIVVTEIPHAIQKSRLVERIAALVTERKVPILADVNDESAEDVRLVLEPRSGNVDENVLMETLFKQTDLEVRVPLNLNVLDATRTPRVMSLREALQAFLDHRREVLIRRSNHRIGKIDARVEVLDGYIIAFLNLDRIIEIIREEDEPKPIMMEEFSLTDVQAEAILNMRLRSLRKLEEMQLRDERKKLVAERKELNSILKDEAKQSAKIAEELKDIRKRFGAKAEGGARRTQ